MKLSLAFVLLVSVVFPVSSARTADDTEVPRHNYIDDDDQRRLADLQFVIEPRSGNSLRLKIGSTGSNVEPIGGYRGIHGHNRYTAEELDLVLRGIHESKVITQNSRGEIFEGRFLAGSFGALLERRLLPNGRIDFLHRTEVLPLQIYVDASTSSLGVLKTTLIIDGQPRFACSYRIRDGRIVDVAVQSLGHDGYIAQDGPGAQKRRRWKPATAEGAKAPVPAEEWDNRDLESRWVLMTAQLAESPGRISEWVAWLAESQQFEMLEWLALYQADAFKSHGVGAHLLEANAPQWIRVAAWHRNTSPYLGHGRQQATQMLLEASPGEVEHWLKANRSEIDNWEPALSVLYSQLEKDETLPRDSSKFLPPFRPEQVFEPLSSSSKVEALGERLEAEDHVLYEHQVTRAINALIISGRRTQDLKEKVRSLINHPNERIRIEALLAHSFLLPVNRTDRVDDFLKIVDDERESDAVREAALLAVSYQDHPYLKLKLHSVAADPEHAGWEAAVSRIGDVGQGYSVQILQEVMGKDLTTEQIKLVGNSLGRLIVRNAKANANSVVMAKALSLSSLAQATSDMHANRIRNWATSLCEAATVKNRMRLRNKYSAASFVTNKNYWMPESSEDWQASYDALHSAVTKQE